MSRSEIDLGRSPDQLLPDRNRYSNFFNLPKEYELINNQTIFYISCLGSLGVLKVKSIKPMRMFLGMFIAAPAVS